MKKMVLDTKADNPLREQIKKLGARMSLKNTFISLQWLPVKTCCNILKNLPKVFFWQFSESRFTASETLRG